MQKRVRKDSSPDLSGHRSGKLVGIERAFKIPRGEWKWLCKCDCGNTHLVLGNKLKRGDVKSCGCYERWKKHGAYNTSEYWAYKEAKTRCVNPNHRVYSSYGGRGIEFKFTSFEHFKETLGLKPSKEYSLDRINNDGNYEPGNVRWATRVQQARNRRERPGKSGYKGVTRQGRKWAAAVYIDGKMQHIGMFTTKELAAQAYQAVVAERATL